MSNIKQIQATISYKTFNDMVWEFELDNQDELDNFIEMLITKELNKLRENASIAEHLGQPVMEFEQWLNKYENDMLIEIAENGSDRELDFDAEIFMENRYDDYVKHTEAKYEHSN